MVKVGQSRRGRNYDCNYTTYVNVTFPGNNFNKNKSSHILELLWWTVEHMMSEDLRLIVLPYPDQPNLLRT